MTNLSAADGAVLTWLRLAFLSLALALVFGALGALHYMPGVTDALNTAGLRLPAVRPLHTTLAHTWIFAVCLAMMTRYLGDQGLSWGDAARHRFSVVCFVTAGAGAIISLLLGFTSGREYLDFHPAVSAFFLAGWIAFAWTFVRHIRRGFWARPVYVYMWTTGVLYFIYTFCEGHAYLLPSVERYPVVDLQIQWKSCGTLVGSFNFMVYGSLIYLGERLSGDVRYAQSKTAFLLFAVGCLNSFTNFAHHTYHLPQDHTVKWIAFIVSMLEIIIVFRVLFDIVAMTRIRRSRAFYHTPNGFLASAKWWTFAMVFYAVFMSVPGLNTLIHGTHAVVGHAMGSELGIDSMILFGVASALLLDLYRGCYATQERINHRRMRGTIVRMNAALALFISWLVVSGTVAGVSRYLGIEEPVWIAKGRWGFIAGGVMVAATLVELLVAWAPLLAGVKDRRAGDRARW